MGKPCVFFLFLLRSQNCTHDLEWVHLSIMMQRAHWIMYLFFKKHEVENFLKPMKSRAGGASKPVLIYVEWIQLECKFRTVFACVTLYFFKLLSYVSLHLFPPLLDEKTEVQDLKWRVPVHTTNYHPSQNSNPDLSAVSHCFLPSPRTIITPSELNRVTWIDSSWWLDLTSWDYSSKY